MMKMISEPKSKDLKRYYQRCRHCFERAFEFTKNPEKGVVITIQDIKHANGLEPKNFNCQFCGYEVKLEEFGGDWLVAKNPPVYSKYKGATPIHWTWYINGSNFQYKKLVDNSLEQFVEGSGTILDIGSGDGLVDSLLMKMGFTVIGIEPEKDGIAAALKMKVDFKQLNTTIEEYVEKEMIPVDYLYSLNTIEHVNDSQAFVKVMESVKNFAIIVTDNAINKEGQRRQQKELHTREFSYEELQGLFSDFRTERFDSGSPSFLGIKVYANNQ